MSDSFHTYDQHSGLRGIRYTLIPVGMLFQRGSTLLVATPYLRNGAATPGFTAFGVAYDETADPAWVFNTAWTFSFPEDSSAPQITAMMAGTLSLSLAAGLGYQATITVSDPWLKAYMLTEFPRWLEPPATIVYEYLDETTMSGILAALFARYKQPRVKKELGKLVASTGNSDYAATGNADADLGTLVAATLAGDYRGLYLTPGAVIGDASFAGTTDVVVRFATPTDGVYADPAFFVRALAGVCGGLSDHEDAAFFVEHHGVIMSCDTVRTLADVPSGALYDLIELVRDDPPFSTIVLEPTDWIDQAHEDPDGGGDGPPVTPSGWAAWFDSDGESLLSIDFAVNITGSDWTPMLNSSAYTDEPSVLDDALATDPEVGGTSPITLAVTEGSSFGWSSATTDAASISPSMPVIQGNRVHGEDDATASTELSFEDQTGAFRCLSVELGSMTEGVVSISNIALYKGGVRSHEGHLGLDLLPAGGGGLLIFESDRVYVHNCIFNENRAVTGNCEGQNIFRGAGGGLNVVGPDSSPFIDGCLFVNGRAATGGGIALYTGAWPVVRHCLLLNNLAQKGGGIYVMQFNVPGQYGDLPASDAFVAFQSSFDDLYDFYLTGTPNAVTAVASVYAGWKDKGPIVLWRSLCDGNQAASDGGNLYVTAWGLMIAAGCCFRFGTCGLDGYRGGTVTQDNRGGGGNIRVTWASDLVLSGGRVTRGLTDANSQGGGGVSLRHSDLGLVLDLTAASGEYPEISWNQASSYHGGGVAFSSSHDLAVTLHDSAVELYWIQQCTFIMLENYDDASTALAEPGFVLTALAAALGFMNGLIDSAFETWYTKYKAHFNMGTSRLRVDGGRITDNTAGSPDSPGGKGGGLCVFRLATPGGEYPETVVANIEWLSNVSVTIAAGVNFSGNGAWEGGDDGHALLYVSDAAVSPTAYQSDADLIPSAPPDAVLDAPYACELT